MKGTNLELYRFKISSFIFVYIFKQISGITTSKVINWTRMKTPLFTISPLAFYSQNWFVNLQWKQDLSPWRSYLGYVDDITWNTGSIFFSSFFSSLGKVGCRRNRKWRVLGLSVHADPPANREAAGASARALRCEVTGSEPRCCALQQDPSQSKQCKWF